MLLTYYNKYKEKSHEASPTEQHVVQTSRDNINIGIIRHY